MNNTLKACLAACAGLGLALSPVAAAQQGSGGSKVSVTVKNVTSDAATIRGVLCPDASTFGQTDCTTGVTAFVKAKTGTVVLDFVNVPSGTYALAVYHDTDGDNRLNIFTEPMAFGNGATDLPPLFDKAALKITADLKTETALFKMIP